MKITDDMLYHHAEAAREKWLSETLPPQIPEHKFSGKFDRKMRKLIREQRHSAQFNRHIKLLQRIAAVFLLVCTISFGCVMTVDAYREKIIETVVRVFNELTDYRFSKSADMPESIAYAFPPTLSYIPDGMGKAEENAGEQLYTVTYEGEDGNFFDLSCTIFTDETQTEKILDTEDVQSTEFELHGETATLFSKNGATTIFWTHDNVLYHLYGTIPADELRNVAKNIA